MIQPDWQTIADNLGKFMMEENFFTSRPKSDLCNILDAKSLKPSEFDFIFTNLLSNQDKYSILDILSHAKVDYGNNLSELLYNLTTLLNVLKLPFLVKLRDTIESIVRTTQTNAMKNEINDELKTKIAPQVNTTNETPENNWTMMSKIPRTTNFFDKIYDMFEKIAHENDIESMKRAVEAKYHLVESVKKDCFSGGNYVETIITYSALMDNFNLTKLIVECGADPSQNGPSGTSPLWYFSRRGNYEAVKCLHKYAIADVNAPTTNSRKSLVFIATEHDHYDIIDFLLTVDGVDVNMRNNKGQTPLSVAKSDRVRNRLIASGAVLN